MRDRQPPASSPVFKVLPSEPWDKRDKRDKSLPIAGLIHVLQKSGKKSTARKIVHEAMEILWEKFKPLKPQRISRLALQSIAIAEVLVRPTSQGGKRQGACSQVSPGRLQFLKIQELVRQTRFRRGQPAAKKMAEVIASCYLSVQPPPRPTRGISAARQGGDSAGSY